MAFLPIEDVFTVAYRLAIRAGAPHHDAEDAAGLTVEELLGRPDITRALVGLRVRSRFVDVVRRNGVSPLPVGLPRETINETGETDLGDLLLAQVPDPSSGPDALPGLDTGRALRALPPRQREVLDACYLRGHSPREAARALGVTRQTMNETRRLALRRARTVLDPSGACLPGGS